ncbi:MAG: histidine kinase [Bacteroidales bacterium]|nr:histidine kinase [Bacteroidales bacterium]
MQAETEILILIVIVVFAMIIMALSIVMFGLQYHKKGISTKLEIEKIKTKQQLELINTISKAQEEERRRISANLHDEVGSSLSAINIMIDEASMITEGRAHDLILSADKSLQKTMTEIRNIIQDITRIIHRFL